MQSYIFDFRCSPTFMRKWNKEFDVEDLENETFKIVLVDDICADNIEECLESNELIYSGSNILSENCNLKYDEEGNSKIQLDGEVEFSFEGSNFRMKGAFITNSSDYVMGYSINTFALNIINGIIFEDNLNLWSIIEGVSDGE